MSERHRATHQLRKTTLPLLKAVQALPPLPRLQQEAPDMLSSPRSGVTTPTRGPRRIRSSNDGPTRHVSSLSVLLDWISTEGNYDRYRGGDGHNGATNNAAARESVRLISEKGIRTVRKPKDVIFKIRPLAQSYRKAMDDLNASGSGITDEESIRHFILARCPHYDSLKNVMADRPSTDPSSQATWTCPPTPRSFHQHHHRLLGVGARLDRAVPGSPVPQSGIISSSKQLDRQTKSRLHEERLQWERECHEPTRELDERRVSCAEMETRSKVQVLRAKAMREQAQAEQEQELTNREKMKTTAEGLLHRKRLRELGVPEEEVNTAFPLEPTI
ncbi:TPA: LOW QUALITY PROTEIN: hypothetical protein N0F65_003626 [Lagenidium giganteum]|uniref:Uncharacterized protein n=1 Tax=Lagenidium giganteum TaxID=4803 RepID=A0AAV2Z1Z5_9STRA|nr:TPA: LOW QUALITY PROTEIN: hypothetical protein N0F65_003626 [Lagenidium giganteum]